MITPPGEELKYCDEYVCLYVCLSILITRKTTRLYFTTPHVRACYLRPLLGYELHHPYLT